MDGLFQTECDVGNEQIDVLASKRKVPLCQYKTCIDTCVRASTSLNNDVSGSTMVCQEFII